MEYVYAALLLHKLKQNITEDSVKNVVKAAGVNPDEVRVKALSAALSEVNIEEALKASTCCRWQLALHQQVGRGAGGRQEQELAHQPLKKKRRKKRRKKKHSKASPRSLDSLPKFLFYLRFAICLGIDFE